MKKTHRSLRAVRVPRALLLPLCLPLLAAVADKPTPTPAPGAAGSSSLADSVRKNQQKPETSKPKKRSLGLITNENLGKGDGEVKVKKGTLSVGPEQKSDEKEPQGPSEWKDAQGHNEQYWRDRAGALRARVEGLEADVKRLEVESRKLENDFYAWSDGNYRDQKIRPAWDQAREDLRKSQEELAATKVALETLADEARKAGAPPGWIREK